MNRKAVVAADQGSRSFSRPERFGIRVIGASRFSDVAPTAVPKAKGLAIGLFARPAASCAVAKTPTFVKIGRQIWQPRSLIIQVKCGTFAATDRFIRCLAQSER
jgi:hypothetical protein